MPKKTQDKSERYRKVNRIPHVSAFGACSVMLFLLFSAVGRILFPYGDEPDWTVRAPRVVLGDHSWWSPYSLFDSLTNKLEYLSNCRVNASPFSVWAHIDASSCTESLEQNMVRFLLTFLVVSPLLFAAIFRKFFVTIMYTLGLRLSSQEWISRLDALSLALVFPGIVYNLGILAVEQLVLAISLFIFLFWGSGLLVAVLISLVVSLDIGNSVINVAFVLFVWFYSKAQKRMKMSKLISLMFVTVLCSFVIGYSILEYVSYIPGIGEKAAAMYKVLEEKGLVEKYPVILRPVITFMTFNFSTPSFVKVVPVYILTGLALWVTIIRVKQRLVYRNAVKYTDFSEQQYLILKHRSIIALSAITFILFFVFLFPNYANAKYYIFTLPFLIFPLLNIFNKTNIRLFFVINNLLVFLCLFLYRF